MSPLVLKGLEAITERTNLATGLTHPNDKNAAKAMFLMLHDAGEALVANEIEAFALTHGWEAEDAKELGKLGSQISAGKRPRVNDGPWWPVGLIQQWRSETQ